MENNEWKEFVHVESSLEPKKGQYAMFCGRFQPLHKSHQALFQRALDEGKNLLICIRDGEINEKNPFSYSHVVIPNSKYPCSTITNWSKGRIKLCQFFWN